MTLTDVEAAWLAGVIDSEGHVGMTRAARRTTQYVLVPRIQVGGVNRAFIERVRALFIKSGCTTSTVLRHYKKVEGRKQMYSVGLWNQANIERVLPQVIPYLIIKRGVAEAMMQWFDDRREARKHRPGKGGGTPYGEETDRLLLALQKYKEEG